MDDNISYGFVPAPTDQVGGNDQRIPFYGQLEVEASGSDPTSLEQHVGIRGPEPLRMGHMVDGLPQIRDVRHAPYPYSNMPGSVAMNYPADMQHLHQQRANPGLQVGAQAAQQHFFSQQYGQHAGHFNHFARPSPIQVQPQMPYANIDPYQYTMHQGYSPIDTRFQPVPHPGYSMPGGYADMCTPRQLPRQPAAASIPSFPRGPPRKPKQSGHALWVGNLPPVANILDLKDHFSRDARKDILSLFLISKSNCAFVNYRSGPACVAAVSRFHDSRFQNVRLVCRLRRGSNATEPAQASNPADGDSVPQVAGVVQDDASTPTIVDGTPSPVSPNEQAPESTTPGSGKITDKYFILKSLTMQDLEASVRNGVWATQSHNEPALNHAFKEADNVYLIFSANKSGEYFGYARMESAIAGDPMPNEPSSVAPTQRPPTASDTPRLISTPATATAPRGRIVDDSGRGTIFWEAELTDDEEDDDTYETAANSEMGRPFKITWICTTRLPFHRTRAFRNPWNSNREVKIARDGTEVEPTIGQRLIQSFHRPMDVTGAPLGRALYGMQPPN